MFHEPRHLGNSSRKQDPAVDYFYSASVRRSRGALWPSFALARIPCSPACSAMAAFPTRAHSGTPRPAEWFPLSTTPTSAAASPALPRGERRPEPAGFSLVPFRGRFPCVYPARRRIDEKDTCCFSSTGGVCQSGIRGSQAPSPRPPPSSPPCLMKDRSNIANGPATIHSWPWLGMRVVGMTSGANGSSAAADAGGAGLPIGTPVSIHLVPAEEPTPYSPSIISLVLSGHSLSRSSWAISTHWRGSSDTEFRN